METARMNRATRIMWRLTLALWLAFATYLVATSAHAAEEVIRSSSVDSTYTAQGPTGSGMVYVDNVDWTEPTYGITKYTGRMYYVTSACTLRVFLAQNDGSGNPINKVYSNETTNITATSGSPANYTFTFTPTYSADDTDFIGFEGGTCASSGTRGRIGWSDWPSGAGFAGNDHSIPVSTIYGDPDALTPPDPRPEPEVTVLQPTDTTYSALSVPYRFVTNVCEDDYPDETPYLTYKLEKWDGDSWESYAITSLGAWTGFLVDNDCDTGLAYAWGAIPNPHFTNTLTAGDYRVSAAARFPDNDYGDYGSAVEFTVVASTVGGGGGSSTVAGGSWVPGDDEDTDVTETVDFSPPACDFTDGFFSGLWECMADFLSWIVFPTGDMVRGVINGLGLNDGVWPLAYITEPLNAIDDGFATGYEDGCDHGEAVVDFGEGVFSGATFDYCDNVNAVGAIVGEYIWYIVAVVLTALGILVYSVLIHSKV